MGLLAPGPQTGYAVSKTTGVPQPKVYETLRKLVSRGAARQLPGEPVHFAATPPSQLLEGLRDSFDTRLDRARTASSRLEIASVPRPQEPASRLADRAEVVAAASQDIERATRRIYLSATSTELASLRLPILSCVQQGVDVVLLCLGEMPFQSPGVRVFRHASLSAVGVLAGQRFRAFVEGSPWLAKILRSARLVSGLVVSVAGGEDEAVRPGRTPNSSVVPASL